MLLKAVLIVVSLIGSACFPENVRWMCLEFDNQCSTSQVEDSLQLYLPSVFPKSRGDASVLADYWPVLTKFGGSDNWPTHSLILPGKTNK